MFVRIVLPLAKPALAIPAIFTLLGSWKDLVRPLIAVDDDQAFLLRLGITTVQGAHRLELSLLMAANALRTLLRIRFLLVAPEAAHLQDGVLGADGLNVRPAR